MCNVSANCFGNLRKHLGASLHREPNTLSGRGKNRIGMKCSRRGPWGTWAHGCVLNDRVSHYFVTHNKDNVSARAYTTLFAFGGISTGFVGFAVMLTLIAGRAFSVGERKIGTRHTAQMRRCCVNNCVNNHKCEAVLRFRCWKFCGQRFPNAIVMQIVSVNVSIECVSYLRFIMQTNMQSHHESDHTRILFRTLFGIVRRMAQFHIPLYSEHNTPYPGAKSHHKK